MQHLAVRLQLQVAQFQLGREAPPAPFQRTDVQRLAKQRTGAALQLAAIFGHQRHQQPPEADVQGSQQQQQGRQSVQPIQDAGEQAAGDGHVSLRPQSGTTS
ncbi:hypothetical protein D3C81_1612800 [compost metagenome]